MKLRDIAAVVTAQAAAPVMTADTAKGPALVDAKSMTLYTFDRDTKPGDTTGNDFLNGA